MTNESKFKIIIVDDSSISREVVVSELKDHKEFELSVFEDPIEALEEIESIQPNFIISDMVMPDMDGFQFCQAVRNIESMVDVPFLLLSGSIDDALHEKALQNGVTHTMKKPFEDYELFKYVDKFAESVLSDYESSVLIVDDSMTIRAALKSELNEMNLKVYEAKSAEEAETILKQYPIELIFLDHYLPVKTGVELCEELRASAEFKAIPVIGISGDNNLAMDFLDAGADDYVSKSFPKKELYKRVTNQLKRNKLSRDLEEALRNERVLSNQKNNLLGVAAHDMRGPLGIIIGYVELIKDGLGDEAFKKDAIEQIYSTAKATLDLLDDILDVSSIESGTISLNKESMNVATLIQERLDVMNKLGSAKSIKGNFRRKVDKNSDVIAPIDKVRMTQVLDNLMSNAIKYSHENTEFAIILDKCVEGLLIEVEDQGQGMTPEDLSGVFEAFKKTSTKSTGGEKSTGLGLFIVQRIVKLHGGKIWAKSEKDKGTTFSFVLPL